PVAMCGTLRLRLDDARRAELSCAGQSPRALARFSKKVLDGQGSQAQGDIVMVFVRQYSAAAERTTSCATLSKRGRLFGGQDDHDCGAKGSRTISVPMSQILERLTWGVDSSSGALR